MNMLAICLTVGPHNWMFSPQHRQFGFVRLISQLARSTWFRCFEANCLRFLGTRLTCAGFPRFGQTPIFPQVCLAELSDMLLDCGRQILSSTICGGPDVAIFMSLSKTNRASNQPPLPLSLRGNSSEDHTLSICPALFTSWFTNINICKCR